MRVRLALLSCLVLAACNDQSPATATSSEAKASASASQGTASAARASARPAPLSASAHVTAPSAPLGLTGAWSGKYDAVKSTIALPDGVTEPAWKADDGKANTGKGDIDLTIAEDGVISGKLSGSLGDASISGMVDGAVLVATFQPAAGSNNGMAGTLVLSQHEGKPELDGEIKASSGDAKTVRTAKVHLTRKER
ncbi:MAG: hypothetical protein U0271_06025 [Polyangiaceae bacterium]